MGGLFKGAAERLRGVVARCAHMRAQFKGFWMLTQILSGGTAQKHTSKPQRQPKMRGNHMSLHETIETKSLHGAHTVQATFPLNWLASGMRVVTCPQANTEHCPGSLVCDPLSHHGAVSLSSLHLTPPPCLFCPPPHLRLLLLRQTIESPSSFHCFSPKMETASQILFLLDPGVCQIIIRGAGTNESSKKSNDALMTWIPPQNPPTFISRPQPLGVHMLLPCTCLGEVLALRAHCVGSACILRTQRLRWGGSIFQSYNPIFGVTS